jgi:hypothetical protein
MQAMLTPNQELALYVIAGLVVFAFLWRRREVFVYFSRRVLTAVIWRVFRKCGFQEG